MPENMTPSFLYDKNIAKLIFLKTSREITEHTEITEFTENYWTFCSVYSVISVCSVIFLNFRYRVKKENHETIELFFVCFVIFRSFVISTDSALFG